MDSYDLPKRAGWQIHYRWDPNPFTADYWFVTDFLRTVSCTDGADKNVYDYYDDSFITNLPEPYIIDVEEESWWNWWFINEELEVGTKRPDLIEDGLWYMLYAEFLVNEVDYFGMRFEPELEDTSGNNLDWCLLTCEYTISWSL